MSALIAHSTSHDGTPEGLARTRVTHLEQTFLRRPKGFCTPKTSRGIAYRGGQKYIMGRPGSQNGIPATMRAVALPPPPTERSVRTQSFCDSTLSPMQVI